MQADELRKRITTVPFQPFLLNVADGRRVPVTGRDFILMSPGGRTVVVYQPDDTSDYLDVMLITGVSYGPPATAPITSELPA